SGEAHLRSFFSDMFYKFINKVSQTQIVPGARDFRLMTRQVVEAIVQMTERNRFSKGLFSWVGFKTKYLP
ncbi:glycosyltransferase, partial [Salmonella enterica subsp. enterica serovar Enteritidis]|nr:glycosyltransferase [Salmonella enterica subsp. enterica serovar Enteritidis]